MRFARVLAMAGLACLASAQGAHGQPAAPAGGPPAASAASPVPDPDHEAEALPEAPATPLVAVEAPPPLSDAVALAKEGRRLLKNHEIAAAVAKLKEAVERGLAEKLDSESQASLHYLYGLMLQRADKDADALQQFQRAVALCPKDSEMRVALAGASPNRG